MKSNSFEKKSREKVKVAKKNNKSLAIIAVEARGVSTLAIKQFLKQLPDLENACLLINTQLNDKSRRELVETVEKITGIEVEGSRSRKKYLSGSISILTDNSSLKLSVSNSTNGKKKLVKTSGQLEFLKSCQSRSKNFIGVILKGTNDLDEMNVAPFFKNGSKLIIQDTVFKKNDGLKLNKKVKQEIIVPINKIGVHINECLVRAYAKSRVKKTSKKRKPGTLPENYFDILEHTILPFIVSKPDGTLLEINKAACELFGYSKSEFVKKKRNDIILINDDLRLKLKEREESGFVKGELIGIKKDGTRFPLEFTSKFFSDKNGEVNVCNTLSDISEQRNSELNRNLLMSNTEESFILIDEELKIISYNTKVEKLYANLLGLNIKIGDSILDYSMPNRKSILLENCLASLKGNGRQTEFKVDQKNGKFNYFQIKFSPAKNKENKIIGVVLTGMDVTEIHNAKEILLANERRFKAIVENGGESIIILNKKAVPIFVSQGVDLAFGKALHPEPNYTIFKMIYAEDLNYVKTKFSESLASPSKPIYGIKYRVKNIEGKLVWIESTFTNFCDDPAVGGVVNNFKDITDAVNLENKKNELSDELKKRNSFIESVLYNLPIGIVVNNIKNKEVTFVNRQFREIFGLDVAEIAIEDIPGNRNLKSEHGSNEILSRIDSMLDYPVDGIVKWDKLEVATKNGKQRFVNVKSMTLEGQGLLISTILDVTRESQQAGEIQLAKANYESLINGTSDLIWSIDSSMNVITANKAYKESIRQYINREPKAGDSVLIDDFGPELVSKWRNYYSRALNGESFLIDEQIYSPVAKRINYARISFNPIYNSDNSLFGVACFSKDVTEDILNLFELQKAKTDLVNIMNSSIDFICTIDGDMNFVKLSASMEEMLGLGSDKLEGINILNFIIQDDHQKTIQVAEEIIKSLEITNFENNVINKEGRVVPVVWSARWDDEDHLVYCVGRDVTADKFKEKALVESENKYKKLFENNPSPMFIWDFTSLQILDANEEALSKYGYTREDFLSLSLRELRPIEDVPMIEAITKSKEIYISTNKSVWRHKKKNGEIMFLEISSHLIEDNDRTYTLALLNDVTEKLKIEEQLKLMESVVVNASDSVVITEADPFDENGHRIIYVNEAFTKMTGYTSEEVVGKTPKLLQGPKSDKLALLGLSKALKRWESYTITMINYKKNGEEFWIELSVTPVANEKGWYTHWIAIERDVTERKNSEIRLEQLNEQLQKHSQELAISNQELEQFAYIASHDLQEPLRMVSSFLTQLENRYNELLDARGKKYIHFAVDGASRMRQIILDLLEYSKVGRGVDELEIVNFNQIIEDVKFFFRQQIDELNGQIEADDLPELKTRRSAIHQVFQNLIGNALKYSRTNVLPQISISIIDLPNVWRFSVKDNGIGINKVYFDKIFVIFQRLHGKGEYSGTGVGLAVAKKIIEQLGGSIWVESEEGFGSTFYFTIPKN